MKIIPIAALLAACTEETLLLGAPPDSGAAVVDRDAAPVADIGGSISRDAGVARDAESSRDSEVDLDASALDVPVLCPVAMPPATPPALSWTPTSTAGRFGFPMGVSADPRMAINRRGDAIIAWRDTWGSLALYRAERREGVWSRPVNRTDSFNGAFNGVGPPSVAIDECGYGAIAWLGGEIPQSRVFISMRTPSGWTDPASDLDALSLGDDARNPDLAKNWDGDMLIAWDEEVVPGARRIYFREFENGAWSAAMRADPRDTYAQVPRVALSRGVGLIVWQQAGEMIGCGPSCTQIFLSEYRNGRWTHPANLQDHISPGAGDNGSPVIAMSDTGENAVIAWMGYDPMATYRIFFSEYRDGAWRHPASQTDFISVGSGHAIIDAVAINDQGDALIVWTESDGVASHIYMSESIGGVWRHPSSIAEHISPEGDASWMASAAIDHYGQAQIVWSQRDPGGTCNSRLYCERLLRSERIGGVWHHPASLAGGVGLDGRVDGARQVVLNAYGAGLTAWTESEGVECAEFFDCMMLYVGVRE